MGIPDNVSATAEFILLFGGIPMGLVGVIIVLIHHADARPSPSAEKLAELSEKYQRPVTLRRRSPDDFRTSRPLGDTVAFLVAVLAGSLIWIVWLGWGNHKNYHPVQVIGCVITGLVAVIALGLLTRWWRTGPLAVALGGLFGFSTAWALDAGPDDSTGLWGVGYLMLLIGGGTVLAAVAAGVIAVRERSLPPRPGPSPVRMPDPEK